MKRTWSQWLAGLALGLVSTTVQAQSMVVVPASSLPPAQPISSPATTTEYVVQPGETLVNAGGPVTYAPQSYASSSVVQASHSHGGGGGAGLFSGGGDSDLTVYGSAGVLLIQPVWQRNASSFTLAAPAGQPVELAVNDFAWNWRAAPEMTLGVRNCEGLGARVHWFQFDQGAQRADTVPANGIVLPANLLGLAAIPIGAGSRLNTESGLALNVWDLDVTQTVQLGRLNLELGGGIRYAHVNQEYNAFSSINAGGGNFRRGASLLSGHNFNGAGPTVSLEAHRPVGCNGFGLYGNSRASLLFGSAKHVTHLIDPTGAVLANASQFETDILPNATLEVGAEYDRAIAGGSAHAFFQVGFHSQVWWNAGSAADLLGNGDANLGLVGMAIRGGLRY